MNAPTIASMMKVKQYKVVRKSMVVGAASVWIVVYFQPVFMKFRERSLLD